MPKIYATSVPRWVFKDDSNRHSEVFRADVGLETGFHAGIGRNADRNNL